MYTFEEILGNEYIIKNIQNAIVNKKISHAYIIDGIKGSGKKLFANTLAKTLQCENNGITPCCNCISCQTFDSNNHTDTIYVKSTKTKSIGVDDIREQIINVVDIKPYKYKYKIFIIDEADTMTVQAQNAILKTLEEPPSYVIFLLISTNFKNFLDTFISRCVLLRINSLSENIIENYLINNCNISKDKALIYSVFSQGSIGLAKELATEKSFTQIRETMIQYIINIKNKNIIELFENAKEFNDYKDDNVLDIWYTWYRDLLMAKNIDTEKYIIQRDILDLIKQEASLINYNDIFKIIDIIENTKNQIRLNANFQLAIEIMLLKIKEI